MAAIEAVTSQRTGWSAPFFLLLPMGLFGATIRAARSRADASSQRAELLEREREATTRAAVADERARVARDLHDVVSHHVAIMTIQAGAASKVMGTCPELARNALAAIEASGREAMGELECSHPTTINPGNPALWQPQPSQLDTLVRGRHATPPTSTCHAGST